MDKQGDLGFHSWPLQALLCGEGGLLLVFFALVFSRRVLVFIFSSSGTSNNGGPDSDGDARLKLVDGGGSFIMEIRCKSKDGNSLPLSCPKRVLHPISDFSLPVSDLPALVCLFSQESPSFLPFFLSSFLPFFLFPFLPSFPPSLLPSFPPSLLLFLSTFFN